MWLLISTAYFFVAFGYFVGIRMDGDYHPNDFWEITSNIVSSLLWFPIALMTFGYRLYNAKGK